MGLHLLLQRIYKRLHDIIFEGDEAVRNLVGKKIKLSSDKEISDEELKKLVSKN